MERIISMLTYRKKILFCDAVLFVVFIGLLFPFVDMITGNMLRKLLEKRSMQLIVRLEATRDAQGMLEVVKSGEFIFQRMTLVDIEGKLLYDSHFLSPLTESNLSEYEGSHPEIDQAIQTGRGYNESYSNVLHESFIY